MLKSLSSAIASIISFKRFLLSTFSALCIVKVIILSNFNKFNISLEDDKELEESWEVELLEELG